MDTRKNRTFEQWQTIVNQLIVNRIGMGIDDLPDWNYWDSWNDGESPIKAALKVIEAVKTF